LSSRTLSIGAQRTKELFLSAVKNHYSMKDSKISPDLLRKVLFPSICSLPFVADPKPITAAFGGGVRTPDLEGAPFPVPAGKVSCATQLPH
jgi:hypothetical protein